MRRSFKKETESIEDVINHLEVDKRYANETTIGFLEALQEEYREKLEDVMKAKMIAIYKRKKISQFITQEDIATAKTIPIRNFLKVNSASKTLCLFHSDKNASMHIYPHSFYCFSCNTSGTVIDIIMKLKSVDFKGAVSFLLSI